MREGGLFCTTIVATRRGFRFPGLVLFVFDIRVEDVPGGLDLAFGVDR